MPAGILEIIGLSVKEKPAAGLCRQRVLESFALVILCQRREHDHKPATGVVVTPV